MVLSISRTAIPILSIVFSFYFPTTLFFSLLLVIKVIETSSITFYLTYFLIRSSCWLNLIFAFTTLMPYPINPPIIAGKIQPNPTSCIGRNLVNTWLTTSMLTPAALNPSNKLMINVTIKLT